MLFYSIILSLLMSLYGFALIILRKGFLNLQDGKNLTQPPVSVIITARNEEENIETCLNAVLKQSYPEHKYEVIVIDDRSQDQTAEIVKNISKRQGQVSLLQIKDISAHFAPKKRAIDAGIQQAKGEIIITTDADCEPGSDWLTEMMRYFAPEVGMVAGYNPYKIKNQRPQLFFKLLALDYFAMACVAAASAGLNYPLSCSGGNLAYRKKLYHQIGGFQNIRQWISGDDDFFMEQVRQRTDWKIRYSIHPGTFVPTAPPAGFNEFINQRIRYASKGRHYSLPVALGLIGVFLLNLFLVIGPVICLFYPNAVIILTANLIVKALAEQFFLFKGRKVFKVKFNINYYLLAFIFHPFYIVATGLLGQFADFKWKDNKYSTTIKQRGYQPEF